MRAFALFGLVFSLAAVSGAAFATTTVGVAPSRLAFDLKPADRHTLTLSYHNGGPETLAVTVYPMDYRRQSDGTVRYLEPSGPLSGGNWIRVEPAAFAAPPGSRTPIRVTVEVPADTPYGEYHAVIFMEAAPPAGEGTLRLGARVGTVLYMAVGEDLLRAAALVPYGQARRPVEPGLLAAARERLRAFTVGSRHVPVLVTGRPFRVFVPVANRGNIHIRPEARISIGRAGGEPEVLRHIGEVILAGDAKILQLQWGNPPFIGIARLELEVEYGGPEPLRSASATLIFPFDLVIGLTLVVLGLRLFGIRGMTIQRVPRPPRKGVSHDAG